MLSAEAERIKNYTDSKPKPSNGIQAGGHGGLNSLYFEGDKCWKPAFSSCEREWYEDMAAGKLHPLAAAVAPKFYGIQTREVTDPATQAKKNLDYLILENATFGFECPCIADLKLGLRTWDKNCDERKMKTHLDIDKASTTSTVGWRFGGVVLCHKLDDGTSQHINLGKNYGVFVPSDRVVEPFLAFLTGDPCHFGCEKPATAASSMAVEKKNVNCAVLAKRCRMIASKLNNIEEFFKLGLYMTFASSVMIVYDAGQNQCSTDDLDSIRVNVHLIDYAHVWHREVYPDDSGALTGVQNLIAMFNSIADDPDSFITRYYHD